MNDKTELEKLISYKRQEESVRKGGIDANTKIKDFNYFKLNFTNELVQEFENMQYKYVLDDKYKITIDELKKRVSKIYNYLKNY